MNLNKRNYKAWLIDKKDFPYEGNIRVQIEFLIGYGILAPSVHNTQPWRFEIHDNTLIIKPELSKKLRVADPDNRGIYISIGACAENIIQAAQYFKLSTIVKTDHDNISIIFKKNNLLTANNFVLDSIKNRHSNKREYHRQPIPKKIVSYLSQERYSGVEVKIVTSPDDINKVATLHKKAATATASNEDFVKELAKWLRLNWTKSENGMPGFVAGNSGLKSFIGRILLKIKPEIFKKMVDNEILLIKSSSALAIFGIKENDQREWIKVGRAIEKFWLRAVSKDLVAHPMTAIMHREGLNKQLAKIIELNGLPVFLMRMGYSKEVRLRTPRGARWSLRSH